MFNSRKYGNTCPYCDISVEQNFKIEAPKVVSRSEDSDKTMPYWEDYEGTEPVVGWLVCIAGSQRGQDYKIRSEKNFIGRSEEMHIQIAGDNCISRKNHAIIIYDPKNRNFILKSGDASGLVYLNEEAVYSSEELNAHDVIQMGKSKFIFIPLCGDHFEWGNDNEKE
jgi:hypothetical protein